MQHLKNLNIVSNNRKALQNQRNEELKLFEPIFTYSKSTMETLEQCVKYVRHRRRSGAFIVTVNIFHAFLVFPLLTFW